MKKNQKIQRRKPQQARALAKCNDILDASARVLVQEGYAKVTMSEVVLESGQPYATIYQYFGGKEDIYLAWMERFIDRGLLDLSRVIESANSSELDAFIELSVRHSLEQIVNNKSVLMGLFGGMPMIASALSELMERKTVEWMAARLGLQMTSQEPSAFMENILMAVRVGNGYWLQVALNRTREINVNDESKKMAKLIRTLLFMR